LNFKRMQNEGMMVNLGGSVFQAFIPKNSFYEGGKSEVAVKYALHGETHIGISQYHLLLTPRIVYAAYGPLNQFVMGANVAYRANRDAAALSLGLYYRLGDAFIPFIGFEFSSFNLGISYDANTGDLSKQIKQTSGLEINLIYKFRDGLTQSLF